jgi:hypothetical protein
VRGRAPIGWRRALVLIAVFGAAVIVAQSCQRSQVRVTDEQAVVTARRVIDFRPTQTQVRLVRQGLTSRPYWAVSFSIPSGTRRDVFRRLAVVRVDANNGKLAEIKGDRRGGGP